MKSEEMARDRYSTQYSSELVGPALCKISGKGWHRRVEDKTSDLSTKIEECYYALLLLSLLICIIAKVLKYSE